MIDMETEIKWKSLVLVYSINLANECFMPKIRHAVYSKRLELDGSDGKQLSC